MKKVSKCEFGYIKYTRTTQLIKTIIAFTIIVIILLTGIIIYDTKNNLLTVFASVGALPFARIAGHFIMFLPYEPTQEDLFHKVQLHNTKCIANYDCIFTTKEKVFPVQAVVTTYNTICAYTISKKVDLKQFEKSLKEFMKTADHNITVHIYKEEHQFLKRVDYLNSTAQNEFTNELIDKMERVNKSMKVMCL